MSILGNSKNVKLIGGILILTIILIIIFYIIRELFPTWGIGNLWGSTFTSALMLAGFIYGIMYFSMRTKGHYISSESSSGGNISNSDSI
jgi:hypothetical protein